MALFKGFRRPINHHIAPGNQAGGVGGNHVAGGSADVTASTHDHGISADGRALLADLVTAVDARFLAAGQQPFAGFGFAVIAVVAVLRGVQRQVIACVQVGFLAGTRTAGADHEVVAGTEGEVLTGNQGGAHLLNVVFLAGDLLGIKRRMLFIRRRRQVHIALGYQRQITRGIQLAANGADVPRSHHLEVATGLDHGAVLGCAAAAHVGADGIGVALFGGGQVYIAPGLNAQVGAAFEGAAGAVDVAPGLQGEGVGGFDAGGVVDEVGAFGAVAAAALVAGDGAFVEHIAIHCADADVAPGDDAAGAVGEGVAGEQVEAVARLHEAAVDHVAPGAGGEVVGGAQGADVVEVGAADQVQVAAGDECAVGRQAVVGLGQVEHGHQHLLAGDGGVFHPHDVVGQGRDLLGGEAHAYGQVKCLLGADGVVHQVLEHRGVAGLAINEALASTGDHGLLDQALFIQAVTQALLCLVRVVAQFGQHVIGA